MPLDHRRAIRHEDRAGDDAWISYFSWDGRRLADEVRRDWAMTVRGASARMAAVGLRVADIAQSLDTTFGNDSPMSAMDLRTGRTLEQEMAAVGAELEALEEVERPPVSDSLTKEDRRLAELQAGLQTATLWLMAFIRPASASGRKVRSTTATAPGVAQMLGRALRPGERLVLRGRASADAQLLVRARSARHAMEAQFDELGLERGGRATILVRSTNGRPTLRLKADERRWRRPSRVTRTTLTVKHPPTVDRIARHERRVVVAYRPSAAYTSIEVLGSRHGKPLARRVLREHGGRARVTLAAGPASRWVRIASANTNGAESPAVVTRIPH